MEGKAEPGLWGDALVDGVTPSLPGVSQAAAGAASSGTQASGDCREG